MIPAYTYPKSALLEGIWMEAKNKSGAKAKRIAGIFIGCAVLAALLLSAFTGTGSAQAETTETVYRESTVERGDITVGVTETATATLKTHNLSFDISAEVEEVYVKAGQSVEKGDSIVLLSAESIQEELRDLQADYQEALAELTEAEVARQKGELEAKSTYNTTINKSDNADSSYELTVEKLELAVTKAKKSVEDIQTEIRTYTKMLNNLDGYDETYNSYLSAKEWYENAKAWVASCKELLKEHEAEDKIAGTCTDTNAHKRFEDNLAEAEADLEYATLEYEDSSEEFSDKYYDTSLTDEDDIKDARTDAKERLADAEAALKEAEYNLQTQTQDAGLSKEEIAAKAEIADSTYELELTRLANNVTSKEVAANNIQEQITKYNTYLQSNLLTAPCDGIVTAVSYEAGDTVSVGSAIATISDSQNVFVYVTITQDDITSISLGQSASLTMDAFDDLKLEGVVDSITTTPVRNASGSASYNVTIQAMGEEAGQIYEGMTGSVTLITRQRQDVLYVSNRCVYEQDGLSYVKVKAAAGTLVETQVETGFSDGRNVEITSGLEEGQTVIIESQVMAQ